MRPPSLISAVEDILLQGCTLLAALDSEVYVDPLEGALGASIGAHYRHVLDHFQCLLDGIRSGVINYDQRRRNPVIETSLAAALDCTEGLRDEFRGLHPSALEGTCTVVYSVAYGEGDCGGVRSNVAREVMFCVGHAIHHFAILKLLCASISVRLPNEFGIAPSTLKHLEAQASH